MSATALPIATHARMFGKYFEYGRYNDVVREMDSLLAGFEDGQACVLATIEGHHLAYAAAPMLDAPRLAAVTSSLCSMGETLTRDLGQHSFVALCVRTATGMALVQRLPRPAQQLILLTAIGEGNTHDQLAGASRACAAAIAAMSLRPTIER